MYDQKISVRSDKDQDMIISTRGFAAFTAYASILSLCINVKYVNEIDITVPYQCLNNFAVL